MRSDLVFLAVAQVSNRFRLCKVATKATRKIHRPHERLQDTINDVLIRFHQANPEAEVVHNASVIPPREWRRDPQNVGRAKLSVDLPQLLTSGDGVVDIPAVEG